jgi:hypothetical protein
MRRVVVVFVLILAGTLWGVTKALGQSAPATDAGSLRADFNQDGFADLAVGVPQDRPGDIPFAGAVNVLYGSAGGLSGSGSQYFTQNTPGVASTAEDNDRLGFSLAAGDFNHDGFADLAVGAPFEGLGSSIGAGAVILLYGSADGLSSASGPLLTQDTRGVGSSAEIYDAFGAALAGGDFNQDGFADLAVGVPDEDVGGIPNAGAVNVLYGSAGGLSGTGSQFFTQETPGVGGSAEGNDLFGSTLAASGSQSEAAAAALLSGSHSGAQSMTPRR